MDAWTKRNYSKDYKMMNKNQKRAIVVIITAVVVIIVSAVIYNLIPRSHLTLYLAPEEGTLSIDSKIQSVKNGQVITLSPGKHTVVFSHNEFDSLSQDITTTNGQTLDFIAVLNPLTDAARALLQSAGAQAVIERFTSKVQVSQTNNLLKNYPILSILPINARLYTINSCQSQKYPDDSTKLALCVDEYHDGLGPYVLKDITSRGYNPADYEIIYINKYNPVDTDY
jgi:hypothetical protein